MWIRGETVKVLLPTYEDADVRMSGIRLLPGGGTAKMLIRQFEKEHLEPAQEIREFLSGSAVA